MPVGYEKNWTRLVGTIEGFYSKHGKWPTRIYLHAEIFKDLKQFLFTPESFETLTQRLEFTVREDAWLIAADEAGNEYSFNKEGMPRGMPETRAPEWLGVSPDR
jgi:hypothetical protein